MVRALSPLPPLFYSLTLALVHVHTRMTHTSRETPASLLDFRKRPRPFNHVRVHCYRRMNYQAVGDISQSNFCRRDKRHSFAIDARFRHAFRRLQNADTYAHVIFIARFYYFGDSCTSAMRSHLRFLVGATRSRRLILRIRNFRKFSGRSHD